MTRSLSLLLALVVLATSACGPSGPLADVTLARADVPRAAADPALAKDAAAAIDAFGVALYRRLASGDQGFVMSPSSIALALGMARAGARGVTATEMDAVLHDLATDANAGWLNALDAALSSRTGTFKDADGRDQPVTLRIADAAFGQKGTTFVPAYLEALASRYGAGLRLVDYRTQTEAARKAINAWVADRTEQWIPELLTPGVLDAATRLTLVDAIYLKAAWLMPFDEKLTRDGAFTRLDGSTVEVPMMGQAEVMPYAKGGDGGGWQAVELPYVGGKLALTIVVPTDLRAFDAALTADVWASITRGLEGRNVRLRVPKFGLETKVDLATTLSALGMPTAFTDAADFSGITTDEPLKISAVIHQANIDVDEKGTTAAAATAVVLRATAMPTEPVSLAVDHPFVFALRDVETGAVLFLGRVTEPKVRS